MKKKQKSSFHEVTLEESQSCVMKLKTWKDLKKEFPLKGGDALAICDYAFENMKQEAIKWVKRLTELTEVPREKWHEINLKKYIPYAFSEKEHLSLAISYNEFNGRIYEIITWIKFFFNIREDDLK